MSLILCLFTSLCILIIGLLLFYIITFYYQYNGWYEDTYGKKSNQNIK